MKTRRPRLKGPSCSPNGPRRIIILDHGVLVRCALALMV
uniref:Uncharacterized protein n=1 Tax=Aegilops tauschii subsp. strangulata TaxID=200361 RepID=A0A453G5Y0_AEGTS